LRIELQPWIRLRKDPLCQLLAVQSGHLDICRPTGFSVQTKSVAD
jgi:hypothetical protein